MNIKIRQQAAYFIVCLENGHIEHSEIVQWADGLIAAGNQNQALLDISVSKKLRDIKAALIDIADQVNLQGIFEAYLYHYLLSLNSISYRQWNRIFRSLWHKEYISDELQSLLYQFDNFIDDGCFDNGYVTAAEVEDLIQEIIGYCKKHAVPHLLNKKEPPKCNNHYN